MAVYKRAGSKYWHIRFQWKGRRINKRTYATSRHSAHQIEAGLRAMLSRGESIAPVITFPLPEEMCRRP